MTDTAPNPDSIYAPKTCAWNELTLNDVAWPNIAVDDHGRTYTYLGIMLQEGCDPLQPGEIVDWISKHRNQPIFVTMRCGMLLLERFLHFRDQPTNYAVYRCSINRLRAALRSFGVYTGRWQEVEDELLTRKIFGRTHSELCNLVDAFGTVIHGNYPIFSSLHPGFATQSPKVTTPETEKRCELSQSVLPADLPSVALIRPNFSTSKKYVSLNAFYRLLSLLIDYVPFRDEPLPRETANPTYNAMIKAGAIPELLELRRFHMHPDLLENDARIPSHGRRYHWFYR